MKKTLSYIYLAGSLILPTTYAIAHGGEVEDAHVEAVPVADPSGRTYVMIGLGIVFALMIAYFINSKLKSRAPMG